MSIDANTYVPKPGDLVQLKSGGPAMTVEARYDPSIHGNIPAADVLVAFFSGGVFQARWFPDIVLKPAEVQS